MSEKENFFQQYSRCADRNVLEREQRLGQFAEKEYNVEKNRIRDAVLKTPAALAG